MMTSSNLNKSTELNSNVSDVIHQYIKDGYKIDAKESAENVDADTFKAVLKKDVDGVECKTVITLRENKSDSGSSFSYNKVDSVGGTKWSSESKHYSESSWHVSDKPSMYERLDDYIKLNNTSDHKYNCRCPSAFSSTTNKEDTEDKPTHIKVNADDSERDVYNKIVDNKEDLKKAFDAKARKDWLASKDSDDEIEDDLVTLVRKLFSI